MRCTAVLRAGLGGALLVAPSLATRFTGSPATGGRILAVRLLAVRYVLQSLLGGRLAPRWHTRADVTVDVVHAVTMVGVALASPTHRRIAGWSAATATGLAVLDALSDEE